MCGIAGILLNPAANRRRLAAIDAMTETRHYRGPDGKGLPGRVSGPALDELKFTTLFCKTASVIHR